DRAAVHWRTDRTVLFREEIRCQLAELSRGFLRRLWLRRGADHDAEPGSCVHEQERDSGEVLTRFSIGGRGMGSINGGVKRSDFRWRATSGDPADADGDS